MGLFSRTVPPRPDSQSAAAQLHKARGDALVPLVFPDQEGLAEAMAELSGDDPVLHQLCLQLGFDQWPQARAAISALGKVPRVSAGTAPTVAAFLVATWPSAPDGYAGYGLNEAAMLLDKQAVELQKQAQSGIPAAGRVQALLVGPGLAGLLALARPPLHVAHRGLASLLVHLGPSDERVRAALMTLLEAPVPSDDAGAGTTTAGPRSCATWWPTSRPRPPPCRLHRRPRRLRRPRTRPKTRAPLPTPPPV